METTLKRNYSIDVLRVFAAFCVVIIHSWFKYQQETLPFTRFAVPCFFLISGYFLYTNDVEKRKQKLTKAIKEITWITIWSSLLYLIVNDSYINLNDISGTLSWIKNNAIFYKLPTGGHLWYLQAYLGTLILLYFAHKKNFSIKIIILIALLLTAKLVLCEFNQYFFKVNTQINYIGLLIGFLFVGLPFVLIGMMIKKYEQKILQFKFVNFRNMAICATIFSISTLLELSITHIRTDVYISNIPQTIFIFLTFLLYKMENDNILSKIGREDSLYIYIFHPLIIHTIPNPHVPDKIMLISPIFYFLVTLFVIRIFKFLHRKLTKTN